LGNKLARPGSISTRFVPAAASQYSRRFLLPAVRVRFVTLGLIIRIRLAIAKLYEVGL